MFSFAAAFICHGVFWRKVPWDPAVRTESRYNAGKYEDWEEIEGSENFDDDDWAPPAGASRIKRSS